MGTSARPSTLTAVHHYNLRNQGWPNQFSCVDDEAGSHARLQDPVQYTRTRIGVYPSNADIIYHAKTAAAQNAIGIGAYSPWHLKRYHYGNTPAAKGHFVLKAFDRNRQLVSGIGSVYDPERDVDSDRPVSVEFYAGRIWYLMPDGRIYFSQILTEIANAEKCFQDADPTAEDINEVVATDGGELNISEMSLGVKLITIGTSLVVFADNGIWSISGGENQPFTATNQEIRKITEIGVVGTNSMVEAEGVVYYWSSGGIYTLQADQISNQLQASNISESTIQTLFLETSEAARRNCLVYYDEKTKKILWLYNDTDDYDGINYRFAYNRILILDLVLQAFYTYSFDASLDVPFIAGVIEKQAGSANKLVENVTTGGAIVTNGPDLVTSAITRKSLSEVRVKFLTFAKQQNGKFKYTFSELSSDSMKDWKSFDGEGLNYVSFAETGENIAEDLISEKESNTMYFFFKKTEESFVLDANDNVVLDKPSSCLLQAKWDWSNLPSAGRWSSPEQIYRFKREYFPIPVGPSPFDYGFEVIQTVQQVRGKGRSLSLRFESEEGKDFHLLGWATPFSFITGA